MTQPLISVILPVYNSEDYLEKCIDSIINQTYNNLEIILVDDGSKDNSLSICERYKRLDSRIKLIKGENAGVSVARNKALEVFQGEYVTFVDSDDWLDLDAYQLLMDDLLANNLSCVYMEAKIVDKNGNYLEDRFHYFDIFTTMDSYSAGALVLKDEIGSQPWKAIYERCCWEDVRFPIGRIYEDLAILYKAILNSPKEIGFTNHRVYNYRMNYNGISFSSNALKKQHDIYLAFKERYEFVQKKMPELREECLAKVAIFAIGVFNCLFSRQNPDDVDIDFDGIRLFLKEHKKEILKNKHIKAKRKTMLKLYFFNEKIYKVFYKIILKILEIEKG